MRVNRSWKISLIGLIILIAVVILIGTPKVIAEAFPPAAVTTSIDRNAELFDVDDVIHQVKAFDKDADAMLVNQENGTILKVYWSNNRENPVIIELISVGEDDFVCRGEDVRSMMTDALNNN